ncbi:MAG: Gfo/Idh/MocA family oxidoreductase [Prevotellaceae bacterium]|jgi:predicted dehydrogenase|nr:Gfo/Idh/MocA family oxidoreductase [Prevotellaceae bacterium]
MKKLIVYLPLVLALLTVGMSSCSLKQQTTGSYAPLTVETPARPAGQSDVLNLVTPKMDTVRVGFIGLGMRGPGAVYRFTNIPGTAVKALCDLYPDRVEKCQQTLEKAGLPRAAAYSGSEDAWKELCERDDIDLVYIATDWVHHVPMMLYAMEHGKHVACEVPAAMNMEDIWAVVNMAEKTRLHCIMLENCVYDFFELTTLNMAQQGVFGDITHVEGAYIHCLEPYWDQYEGDWRMKYNKEYRGDVYATHGFGPACQLLDIHRGDRLTYLTSMDSDPISIPNFIRNDSVRQSRGEDPTGFKNGEHTTTMIRTQKGRTILIEHNVASPRPYSRMYQVTGTKGFANKYPYEGYAIEASQVDPAIAKDHENLSGHSFVPRDVKTALMEQYKHPIHRELEETAKKVGGHGGMDFIMDYRLVYCLRNGLPLDMDVYDLAEWCCLAPLTALSIENSSAPVAIPDFTRGGWDKIKGYRHAFAK